MINFPTDTRPELCGGRSRSLPTPAAWRVPRRGDSTLDHECVEWFRNFLQLPRLSRPMVPSIWLAGVKKLNNIDYFHLTCISVYFQNNLVFIKRFTQHPVDPVVIEPSARFGGGQNHQACVWPTAPPVTWGTSSRPQEWADATFVYFCCD